MTNKERKIKEKYKPNLVSDGIPTGGKYWCSNGFNCPDPQQGGWCFLK